jgi:hypothetical protein
VGVQPENDAIKLNPGSTYIMKPSDICFYMSITKEENSQIAEKANDNLTDDDLKLTEQLTRRLSFRRASFSTSKTTTSISGETKPMLKKSASTKLNSTSQACKGADIKINVEDTSNATDNQTPNTNQSEKSPDASNEIFSFLSSDSKENEYNFFFCITFKKKKLF